MLKYKCSSSANRALTNFLPIIVALIYFLPQHVI